MHLLVFKLGAHMGETDGRTGGQDPYCGLLGRPHNNNQTNH